MANQRMSYVFGVKRLKPWRKPGSQKSLKEMLEEPEHIPKRHQPTVVNQPINSIVRELFRWQRIHENSILNPDTMVTEDELYPSLPPDHSPPLPRAHPVPYPCHRWSQLPTHVKFHNGRTSRAFHDYNLPQMFAPDADILAGIQSTKTSSPDFIAWQGSECSSSPVMESPKPSVAMTRSRPLLRRPLERPKSSTEIPRIECESEENMALTTTDLGAFTKFSLTTLDNTPDRPLDVAAFYEDNYPLTLRVIPCRTGPTQREGISMAYLYHVMEPREISTNAFAPRDLSTPSMSSLNQLSSHSPSSNMHIMNNTLTLPSSVGSDSDTTLRD